MALANRNETIRKLMSDIKEKDNQIDTQKKELSKINRFYQELTTEQKNKISKIIEFDSSDSGKIFYIVLMSSTFYLTSFFRTRR